MIAVSNISKRYGEVRAVRDVSFEIATGQIVGLLGPNGAGKTTTIRMITGFIPPTGGSIRVCGHDTLTDSRAARAKIGYLPEAAPLYPEMRVRDYLDHRGRLYKLDRGARRLASGSRMEQCGLTGVAGRRIGHLSKGYRQRVGLAAALLHDPPVLILDEPTNGLDPSQIRQARSLIRDLATDRTVLVSSHILPEIEKTCDRVIVIAGGTVRADGTPADLVAGMDGSSIPVRVVIGGAEAGTARDVVANVEGVDKVVFTPGDPVVLSVVGSATVQPAIARAIGAAGFDLIEMTRPHPTLEQLFVRIIEDDGTGGSA